jgi:hypothetical protein
MIKNIIISGCSFTCIKDQQTWPLFLEQYTDAKIYNLAHLGAGNDYICRSVIDTIEHHRFDPNETLILVMWSGTMRKDLRVGPEFWWKLKNYVYKFCSVPSEKDCFFVGSCGGYDAWNKNADVKQLFTMSYLASDPHTLVKDSLVNFVMLESYLQQRNYNFKFTSFYNQWETNRESSDAGDYLLSHYAQDLAIYKNFDYSNWFFVDEEKNSLWEFAKKHNMIADDHWHPNAEAHKLYAEQIVWPNIKEYFK